MAWDPLAVNLLPSLVWACVFMWLLLGGGALLCPFALCPRHAVVCSPGHASLSPGQWCQALAKYTCDFTDGLLFFFFQAVVVYLHPVRRSVCCAPPPHLHFVQRGAAHLPTELLHAMAQRISYPRYVNNVSTCWQHQNNSWSLQRSWLFEAGSDLMRVTGSNLQINTPLASVQTETDNNHG